MFGPSSPKTIDLLFLSHIFSFISSYARKYPIIYVLRNFNTLSCKIRITLLLLIRFTNISLSIFLNSRYERCARNIFTPLPEGNMNSNSIEQLNRGHEKNWSNRILGFVSPGSMCWCVCVCWCTPTIISIVDFITQVDLYAHGTP